MSWVAAAIGASALISGGVSMHNSKKAREASKKNSIKTGSGLLKQYDQYTDESGVRDSMSKFSALADMFGQQANQNYLSTTEGKSFTRQIEDVTKKRANRLRSDAGLMGLTSEAYLSGLGKINEQEGASMNQLVSGADARKRALRSQQMQALSQVLGGEQGLFQSQQSRFGMAHGLGAQISNTASNAQAVSNQNMTNMIGALGNATATYFGNRASGGGNVPQWGNAPSYGDIYAQRNG